MPHEKDDVEAGRPAPIGKFTFHSGYAVLSDNVDDGRTLSRFSNIIQRLDSLDAEERYREEVADNRVYGVPLPDQAINGDGAAENVISWNENDAENPYNWPNVSQFLRREKKNNVRLIVL